MPTSHHYPFHFNRILLVRLSSMGDVLLTTPIIRMLKTVHPNLQIDFLTKKMYEPLLKCNPHINRLIVFSSEEGISGVRRQIQGVGYDYIVDLQKNLRSLMVRFITRKRKTISCRLGRWERFLLVRFRMYLEREFKPIPVRYFETLEPLKIKDDGLGLELAIEEKAGRSIDTFLLDQRIGDVEGAIVFVPGSSYRTKCWPTAKFAQVGDYFHKRGRYVFLVGGDNDKTVCQKVEDAMTAPPFNLTGRLSLQETAALIKKTALLITNDTGVMHMGVALQKPIVAVFGPTTRHLGFMPFRSSAVIIERPVHCRPCSYHGTESCPEDHFQCMEQIHCGDVIRAAETLLQGN